jgi:hypothetical protein
MSRKSFFSSIGHAAVVATVAAVTLAAPAVAETGPAGKGLSAAPVTRDASDFSASRRVHHGAGAGAVAIAAPMTALMNAARFIVAPITSAKAPMADMARLFLPAGNRDFPTGWPLTRWRSISITLKQ